MNNQPHFTPRPREVLKILPYKRGDLVGIVFSHAVEHFLLPPGDMLKLAKRLRRLAREAGAPEEKKK